jgi:YVTN family beta-propeller protein
VIRAALAAVLTATPANAEVAFITAQEAGSVAVIDLATAAVACVAEIGGAPAAVAVDRKARLAYAVATESGADFAITPDCDTRKVMTLDGGPFGIAVNPVRGVLYVGDWYNARLYEIDPTAGKVLRSFLVGKAPGGIAVTPDGATIISADRDDNRISLLDAATGETRATVAVGQHPFGVTIFEGQAFVANVEGDSVSVVDLSTRDVTATIPTGLRPYAVAFAGDKGFVTDQYADTVTVFDARSFAPRATIDVGFYPEGIAATEDGRVLVANWDSNTVTLIDSATLAVLTEIEVPDGPRAFGDFVLP